MSKVLLDHVPARTPGEFVSAAPVRPGNERRKIEAGESSASWPTYRDTAGVYEIRHPSGWAVEPMDTGMRLAGETMTVTVEVRTTGGMSVDQLARLRVGQLADLGAAQVVDVEGTTIDGRPATAIEELATGDGHVTLRMYVEVDETTYLSVVATAVPGAFDRATVDAIIGSLRVPTGVEPGVVDQLRP